jgi:N6-adenosine-specific RNA methylase IME4
MINEEQSLVLLNNATRLLAQVKDASSAKKLMDMAAAAEHYAKKAKMSREAIDHAYAIKIDAMALLGKFYKEGPKNEGAKGSVVTGGRRIPLKDETPTLSDLGLTKRESVESQLLATIAKDEIELFNSIRTHEKTLSEVKREIIKKKLENKTPELPSSKYKVIYADPPWSYNDKCDEGGVQHSAGAAHHYPTMSITQLCSLNIKELSDENAVLFMWTTVPLLYDAQPVFKSWGFDYKTSFVWDKVRHNMGHYSSVRHEILLVCVKGSCTPENPKLFDSVQAIEKTPTHSEKPEEFRNIIDTLYPSGKRIELFARKKTDGWDTWGNEAN